MDAIDLIPKYLAILRPISWRWERNWMESLQVDLGLRLERRNDTWTRYRMADEANRCSLLWDSASVIRLEIFVLVDEELGDLRVYDPFRYQQVCEQVFQDFDEKYQRALVQAEAVLGPPWFQGCWRDSSCPDRIISPIRIAAWAVEGGQLMLEYQHEDNELPLIISIVVQRSANGE